MPKINLIDYGGNKMLDIISMITFILLFMGLPLFLIIKGGSYKTDDEQEIENEEQNDNYSCIRVMHYIVFSLWTK